MKLFLAGLISVALQSTVQANIKIIFVPGIKGSKLKSFNDENLVWTNLWQLLNFTTPDLSIERELFASEVLDKVKLSPLNIGFSVYEHWLDSFRKWPNTFNFPYDWRHDNLKSLAQLKTYVTLSSIDNSEICLIGHSMGGLLSMALTYDPKVKISKLVVVGSPLRGGIGFLKDLQIGESNGLNSKILSPEILANFPSVYSFFPLDGIGLYSEQKDPVAMDFFNAQNWEENQVGIFSIKKLTQIEKDKFQTNLNLAKTFRNLFLQKAKPPNTEVLVIRGKGQPTLVGVQKQGHKWNFESWPKQSGDMRVAATDAVPVFDDYKLLETEFEHSKLLDDPNVQNEIKDFCLKKVL